MSGRIAATNDIFVFVASVFVCHAEPGRSVTRRHLCVRGLCVRLPCGAWAEDIFMFVGCIQKKHETTKHSKPLLKAQAQILFLQPRPKFASTNLLGTTILRERVLWRRTVCMPRSESKLTVKSKKEPFEKSLPGALVPDVMFVRPNGCILF